MKGALRAAAWFSAATLLVCALTGAAFAQEATAPSALTVYWKESATLSIPGVTRVLVLDDSICRAETAGDAVRLDGVSVGDTVMFVWIGDMRTARVVRVMQKPISSAPAGLSQAGRDAAGHGRAGASVMSNGSSAATPIVTHQYWDWQQGRNGSRLAIRGFTNIYKGNGHAFNVGSVSIEHTSGGRKLSLADFTLNLGAADSPSASLSQFGSFGVRGIDYAATRGSNRVELFAGTTVPAFFLSFGGTRGIAGIKVDRSVGANLKLFSTAGAVHAPALYVTERAPAAIPFGTTGVIYTPSTRVAFTATGGVSNRGFLGDVQADYSYGHFAGSVAATDTSSNFPLNRVQLLTAGESSVRGMAGLSWEHLSVSTAARHAVSKPGGLAVLQGSSDSISENVQARLPGRQQLSAAVTRNVATSAVLPSSENNRIDGSWSSPIGTRFSNTLQAGVGRYTESTQLNSYQERSVRDSATLMLPRGSLFASFERQRLAPSTAGRIRQVLDTLPAELRDLFSADPVLFMQTVDLPADIRRLLETVQPASSSISAGAQLGLGRLSISPSVSVLSDTLNGASPRRSYTLGYSASWQFATSWQLRSALSSRVFYANPTQGFRRTNVLTIGLDKSLTGLPRWIAPAGVTSTLEGWVFRDNGVNGAFDPADPGLAGVRVRLDATHVAATDNSGHFKFKGVAPGRHHLSLDLAQFPGRVRVTTPSELELEVIDRTVQVNFGIVNFSRVIGTVFNDYQNDANRQSDAPGLPRIHVRLTSGSYSTVVTSDSSGDFEAADLPPGDYSLTLAAEDLPANYVAPETAQQIHVDPIATAVADLPVRALRSIAGRVLLRTGPDQAPRLEPIAGVTIVAGHATALTDAQGRYSLRDLPAGAIEIRVVPVRDVPQNMRAPLGVVRLKPEPTRIENANIIISNPALMDYLTTQAPPSSSGARRR